MSKRLQTLNYVLADWLAASFAWGLFYLYRKLVIESSMYGKEVVRFDHNFYLGIFLLPFLWILVYALIGTYKNVYRKSRLRELGQTLYISVIGVLIIFFTLLLDDAIVNYKTYYHTLLTLLSLHFLITASLRFALSTNIIHKIHSKKIAFNSVLIGSNQKAVTLLQQMEKEFRSEGNKFIGFVNVEGNNDHLLAKYLPLYLI